MILPHKTVIAQSCKRKLSATRGFTLIELLVVIAIVALLLAIVLPALKKAKYHARVVICATKQHQILLALQTYSAANNMKLPPTIQSGASPNCLVRAAFDITDQFAGSLPDYEPFRCPLAPFKSDDILNGTTKSFRQLYYDAVNGNPLPNNFDDYVLVSSYWLMWNYTGWDSVGFKPRSKGKHNLMISDVMSLGDSTFGGNDRYDWGFNHYDKYSEKNPNNQQFWITSKSKIPDVKQNAGYLDGHVKLTKVAQWRSYLNKYYFPETWQ
jgi:prepilin-type N-terminal cleavage/methylation domain-containing protein